MDGLLRISFNRVRFWRAVCVFAVALVGLSNAQGCANTADVDVQRNGAAVINGTPVNSAPYDAVGSIHVGADRELVCAATLISSNAVLTAGHCVSEESVDDLAVQFMSSVSAAGPSDYIPVTTVAIHPNFNGMVLNDIAVLELAQSVAADPIPLLPATLEFENSDVAALDLDIVGFGRDENGDFGVRRSRVLALGALGCGVPGCPSEFAQNPTVISYRQDVGGPCSFDSGGPAFIVRDSALFVGAVSASGDANCVQWGVSVSVAPFRDWIAQQVDVSNVGDGGVPVAGMGGSAGGGAGSGTGGTGGTNVDGNSGGCAIIPMASNPSWFLWLAWLAAWFYSKTRT